MPGQQPGRVAASAKLPLTTHHPATLQPPSQNRKSDSEILLMYQGLSGGPWGRTTAARRCAQALDGLESLRWVCHRPPRPPFCGRCGVSRAYFASDRSPRPTTVARTWAPSSHQPRRTLPNPPAK
ncbi:hypothetical protein GCM10009544_17290 [Streptomyces stramineus]|uniref:Uncharacterized protein n=1 Tax=Streptomyces stramineus TaxID=173861 RepID=A0ABP3JIT1_9ACTN